MKRWAWLCIFWAAAIRLHALVFPLPPNENGEYDVQHNVLPSIQSAWASNHTILNFHSANAVAIAPRWFITARHLVNGKDTNFWANDGFQRYYVVEHHDVGHDLSVVRVDRPFSDYSELRKTPVPPNEVLTIYGQSAAGGDPIYTEWGEHAGWKLAPNAHFPRVRWGQIRTTKALPTLVQWVFRGDDPELGLNCAGTATNDSGGGIFLGTQLAGITTGGNFDSYRPSTNRPFGNCEDGHVFRPEEFWQCVANIRPKAFGQGTAVYPSLSNIFAKIAPPVRVNAGGPALGSNPAWSSWIGGATGSIFTATPEFAIATNNLLNPAPADVYRSEVYLQGQPGQSLEFTASELIRYEKYKVRLHFSSIHSASAPGVARQTISANGQSMTLDPYAGPATASEYTFYHVVPDALGRINVAIVPANELGNATISGIEIEVMTAWPTDPSRFTWTKINEALEIRAFKNIAFGNGVFVATGFREVFYSTDLGETWHPGSNVPPVSYDQVVFGDGTFVISGDRGLMLSSTNGRDWILSQTPTGGQSWLLLHGNGVFLSNSYYGLFTASRTGNDWSWWSNEYFEGLSFPLGAFGNGRFVNLRSTGSAVLWSEDGFNWTRSATAWPPPPDPRCPKGENCGEIAPSWGGIESIAFFNGEFVANRASVAQIAAGPPPTNLTSRSLLVSTDGIEWRYPADGKPRTAAVSGTSRSLNGHLIFGGSKNVTTNLIDFEPADVPFPIAWGNERYVGFASGTIVTGAALDSLEAVTNAFRQRRFGPIARTDDQSARMVLFNSSPEAREPLLFSPTPGVFQRSAVPSDDHIPNALKFGGGRFVTAGSNGTILASTTGERFDAVPSGTNAELYDLAFGRNRWVAVGAGGAVVVSTNFAANFSPIAVPTGQTLRGIAHGGNTFVAVGNGGTILTSTDSGNWTPRVAEFIDDLFAIGYGGGTFAAAGANGLILASRDGESWRAVRTQPGQILAQMVFGNGVFLALEQGSRKALFSRDGHTWHMIELPENAEFLSSSNGEIWLSGPNAYLGRNAHLTLSLSRGVSLRIQANPSASGIFNLIATDNPGGGKWEVLTNFSAGRTFTWTEKELHPHRFFKIEQK